MMGDNGAASEAQVTESVTVMVGDIHGNLTELTALWHKLEGRLGADGLLRATVIFLGDYCDRGPHTRGVLDFLIELKRERERAQLEAYDGPDVCGKVHFIAGNHDLGMAAYLGCLPINGDPPFDLDSTIDPAYKTGFYSHSVEGGMHYAGRRWGGSGAYNAGPTFASYGVDFKYTAAAREKLLQAVPEEHKDFLESLQWVHDQHLPHPPGRLVCVHAGLKPGADVEAQIEALKRRDLAADILHERRRDGTADISRFAAFHGRGDVLKSTADFYLVSGHHGFHRVKGNRVILDASGGSPTPDRPLQAFILPFREVVS